MKDIEAGAKNGPPRGAPDAGVWRFSRSMDLEAATCTVQQRDDSVARLALVLDAHTSDDLFMTRADCELDGW